MWKPLSHHVDPITRLAGAALICNTVAECLSSRQAEVCSEVLAWIILPAIFTTGGRPEAIKSSKTILPGNLDLPPASAISQWVVALGIVTFSVFRAENGMVQVLPALTPLLLAAQKYYLNSEPHAPGTSDLRLFSPFVSSIWGTALSASFITITIANWDLQPLALSAIPVVALLVVYVTLTPRAGKRTRYPSFFDLESAIVPLSLRVVLLLVIILVAETIAFEFPKSEVFPMLAAGMAKALTWYYLAQSARHSSWLIASTTGTFSAVSAHNPFAHAASVQPSLSVAASFLALGQVIHLLPKQAKAKSALWALALASLVPYLTNTIAIESAKSSLIRFQTHPVEALIQNAHNSFENLLQRQSQNYAAAHDEYLRRYGIEPPPGFQAWFNFAISHQSPIIDEFDMIHNAISPLRSLSGKQVRDIMHRAQDNPHTDLWFCTFSGSERQTRCGHRRRSFDRHTQLLFNKLFKDFPIELPTVTFLVNHLDEPRVLIPPSGAPVSGIEYNLADWSRVPAWDGLTKFCGLLGDQTDVQNKNPADTFGLPFITNPLSDMDLCQHTEYRNLHGLAICPTSLLIIQGAIPVLSTGSPAIMGDILYPSAAYIEPEFRYSESSHDPDWDHKANNLYWAGSTTGGFAVDRTWHRFHRQRFVELAQNLAPREHSYLHEAENGVISRVKSSFFNGRLFDVAFTRIFQCEPKECRAQRRYFNVKSWADKDRPLRSRFVFDSDGNGISGRYYKLLGSKSVPLKQTLLREWHDERLVPWVHYIPVSQSMEELPEMMLYLTSSQAGQKRAKEVADQGREWFSKAFREVDMAIYLYRLLLELARLQDPAREASPPASTSAR